MYLEKGVVMVEDKKAMDPQEAETMMCYVLEHYIKHHDVVLKKLDHAKNATKRSIDEINVEGANSGQSNLQEIQAYDEMWNCVIEHFRDSGISEEELIKIESILTKVPKLIKKYYDLLVEQDLVLQELMVELQSKEYQEALDVTNAVQSRSDLLSGLDPKEFDHKDLDAAFMFQVPSGKEISH